ncbi:MAG: hypothetical protein RML94_00010 [Bacteroidia bacterium]|nr:hypothetical protein [Bacteroidia bacterium]
MKASKNILIEGEVGKGATASVPYLSPFITEGLTASEVNELRSFISDKIEIKPDSLSSTQNVEGWKKVKLPNIYLLYLQNKYLFCRQISNGCVTAVDRKNKKNETFFVWK